jgi:FtsZ-interacting cell division protein YlmF
MKEKMRKALGFLGLIEDEYGDYSSGTASRPFTNQPEYDEEVEWRVNGSTRPNAGPSAMPPRGAPSPPRATSISVLDGTGQAPRVRPMPSNRARATAPLAQDREPVVFLPTTYNESRRITDVLRSSRAVVLNVTELESGVARRLVDFASGTAYALNAKIEPLAQGVYLIIPQGANVSGDARQQLRLSQFRTFERP